MSEKWKVRKNPKGIFVCVDGSPIGVPQEVCRVYNCSKAQQRSHLLSAAPELLAALESVVAVADRSTVEFDKARAAIAKAKGELIL